MVRSAEQGQVEFPVRVSGRVRLVKHVVTEQVTRTFTLRREELRIEEVPGDPPTVEPSRTYQFPADDSERDFTIVLHAERVAVDVVPVERIRVSTRVLETGTEVTAQLRTEHVSTEHVDVDQT